MNAAVARRMAPLLLDLCESERERRRAEQAKEADNKEAAA